MKAKLDVNRKKELVLTAIAFAILFLTIIIVPQIPTGFLSFSPNSEGELILKETYLQNYTLEFNLENVTSISINGSFIENSDSKIIIELENENITITQKQKTRNLITGHAIKESEEIEINLPEENLENNTNETFVNNITEINTTIEILMNETNTTEQNNETEINTTTEVSMNETNATTNLTIEESANNTINITKINNSQNNNTYTKIIEEQNITNKTQEIIEEINQTIKEQNTINFQETKTFNPQLLKKIHIITNTEPTYIDTIKIQVKKIISLKKRFEDINISLNETKTYLMTEHFEEKYNFYDFTSSEGYEYKVEKNK